MRRRQRRGNENGRDHGGRDEGARPAGREAGRGAGAPPRRRPSARRARPDQIDAEPGRGERGRDREEKPALPKVGHRDARRGDRGDDPSHRAPFVRGDLGDDRAGEHEEEKGREVELRSVPREERREDRERRPRGRRAAASPARRDEAGGVEHDERQCEVLADVLEAARSRHERRRDREDEAREDPGRAASPQPRGKKREGNDREREEKRREEPDEGGEIARSPRQDAVGPAVEILHRGRGLPKDAEPLGPLRPDVEGRQVLAPRDHRGVAEMGRALGLEPRPPDALSKRPARRVREAEERREGGDEKDSISAVHAHRALRPVRPAVRPETYCPHRAILPYYGVPLKRL